MSTTEIPSDLINTVSSSDLDKWNQTILESIIKREDVESSLYLERLLSQQDAGCQNRPLILGLIKIWMTASKRSAKVKGLVSSLRLSGVSDERSDKFGQLWSATAKQAIEAMRHYSHNINPSQLTKVDLKLKRNSTLDESGCVIQTNLVQLDLKRADGASVSLDIGKDQLGDLFGQIETIQSQLDSLLKT